MAFAHKVVRVTISGTCFGDSEIWSTGFYLGREDADAEAPTDANAATVAAAWATMFTHADTKIGSNYFSSTVKLALLNVDGKTDLENVVQYDWATRPQGPNGGTTYPAQIALVASLRSEKKRGIASHGRMYLPGVSAPIDGTGKMTSSFYPAIATKVGALFQTLVTDTTLPGYPVLASKGKAGLFAGAGETQGITSVKVGNVYDTQRRRRNALVESYSTVAITP